jgi:hypothetical protein
MRLALLQLFAFLFAFPPCAVTPHVRCRLRLLKMERIKDYLILEEEFIENQERLKPREEKTEVRLRRSRYTEN